VTGFNEIANMKVHRTQLQVQMSKRLTLSIMSKSCFAASCVFMYRGGSKILFPFIKFSIVCSFTFISSKLSIRYKNIFVKRFFRILYRNRACDIPTFGFSQFYHSSYLVARNHPRSRTKQSLRNYKAGGHNNQLRS
jgi:hypothetical protein